jgi:hypothetical protein
MTQSATSTNNAALGYAPQNKVAELWDGTLLTGYYDGSTTVKLVQVSTPSGTPSFTTLAQTFSIASSTSVNFDLFTLDNGNSTNDVWVVFASNSGTAGVKVAHATYDSSGTWTWDNTGTTVSGVGGTAGDIATIVWTGTTLIVGWRDSVSNVWSFKINYTTTKNGSSGWQASSIQLSSTSTSGSSGEPTHYQGSMHYDPTLGVVSAVYPLGTTGTNADKVVVRALAASSTPVLANWTAETVLASGLNVGAANFASSLDHTAGVLHVVWCDSASGTSKSPAYCNVTFSGTNNTTLTASSPIAIGTASTAAINPNVGVDAAGTVWVFWAPAAAGSNGQIKYASAASPYTSFSAVSSFGTTTNDNNHPHIPNRQRFSGYVPLLYQYTATSPYSIQYDNSIPAGSGGTTDALVGTVTSYGAVAGTLTKTDPLAAAASASGGLAGSMAVTRALSSAILSAGLIAGVLTNTDSLSGTVPSGGNTHAALTAGAPALAGAIASSGGVSGSPLKTDPLTGAIGSEGTIRAASLTATRALRGTVAGSGALSAALTNTDALRATCGASGGLAATLTNVDALSGSVGSNGGGFAALTSGKAGTGIGGLTRSTCTATWVNSGSGTETDITYTDATGSGWTLGAIPSYGGAVWSPWYELNAYTPTPPTGEQTSLTTTWGNGTTNPDGFTHALIHHTSNVLQGQAYDGSESYSYTLTELGPTGTSFRRYYQAAVNGGVGVGDGLIWTVTSCVYPGDPGIIVDRIDIHNPSASAVTLASASDAINLTAIGGLISDTAASPGNWSAGNAEYGTAGSPPTGTLPNTGSSGPGSGGTALSAEPDYVSITPDAGKGTIGVGAVKITKLSGTGGLAPSGTTHIAADQNTNRVKIYWETNLPSIGAGQTVTLYSVKALKRNLDGNFMAAFSADQLKPGTPTTTTGSFTAFRQDERAYEFAASGNALSATLDLSPTGVTTRYKPILKVTGWTDVSCHLTWGGTPLVLGTDYQRLYDATNHVMYVQLYFDVTAAAPSVSGQKQNSTLAMTAGSAALSGIVAGSPEVLGTLTQSDALQSAVGSSGNAAGTLTTSRHLAGSPGSSTGLAGTLTDSIAIGGHVSSGAAASGALTHTDALSGATVAAPGLAGTLTHGAPLAGICSSVSGLRGSLTETEILAGQINGTGALVGSLVHPADALSGSVVTGGAVVGTFTEVHALAARLVSGTSIAAVLTGAPPTHLASLVPRGMRVTVRAASAVHLALTVED